jgi:hypothetical protein
MWPPRRLRCIAFDDLMASQARSDFIKATIIFLGWTAIVRPSQAVLAREPYKFGKHPTSNIERRTGKGGREGQWARFGFARWGSMFPPSSKAESNQNQSESRRAAPDLRSEIALPKGESHSIKSNQAQSSPWQGGGCGTGFPVPPRRDSRDFPVPCSRTGDWKVARTRRQECRRNIADARPTPGGPSPPPHIRRPPGPVADRTLHLT